MTHDTQADKCAKGWKWSWGGLWIGFVPKDFWVGIYVDKESPHYDGGWFGRCDIYVCVVPMLPLRLRFWATTKGTK